MNTGLQGETGSFSRRHENNGTGWEQSAVAKTNTGQNGTGITVPSRPHGIVPVRKVSVAFSRQYASYQPETSTMRPSTSPPVLGRVQEETVTGCEVQHPTTEVESTQISDGETVRPVRWPFESGNSGIVPPRPVPSRSEARDKP